MFKITEEFTEEEIASIMSALNYYAYNEPSMDDERYEWAMSALDKVASAVE